MLVICLAAALPVMVWCCCGFVYLSNYLCLLLCVLFVVPFLVSDSMCKLLAIKSIATAHLRWVCKKVRLLFTVTHLASVFARRLVKRIQ